MSTYTDASLIVTPNAKKAGKLYSLKGADLDVVRATTATYVGDDGLIKTALANEVRFDYTNGSCPSILVEPQRTNLLLRSEEFDNASWTKVRATITSNLTASPDGNLTAGRISCNETSSNGCFIRQTTSLTTERTASIFVKPNTAQYFQIHRDFGSGVVFDLINGTIKQSVGATGTITEYANGWYRCTATFSVSGLSLFIVGNASMTVTNWFSTINESLFIWGAQLEAGSNATSYIPTTSSAVTRNADVISKTGISSLIGQTEGTLYWEGRLQGQSFNDGVVRTLLSISDGTISNRIEIYRLNNEIYYTNVVGGAVQFVAPVFTITDFTGQLLKLVITYTLNDVKMFINGVLVNTDSTALIPACNQINIGSIRTGGSQWSGLIKGTVLLPLLTNTQAIQLTTL